ncbi:MAG TPA: hypothetical protein VMU75_02600 [Acidimicrobiales bacterium]|nr:hypothetical protein [Acidimicrobiales bacterium]
MKLPATPGAVIRDHEDVGRQPVADERLRAVDDALVPVSYRSGLHAMQVAAGVRLGHRDRRDG